MQVDKADYPENSRVVFFPNKQRSFEPFMCLDLVLERLKSFLFHIFTHFNANKNDHSNTKEKSYLFLRKLRVAATVADDYAQNAVVLGHFRLSQADSYCSVSVLFMQMSLSNTEIFINGF